MAASSAWPVGTFLRFSPPPLGLNGFTGPWAGRVSSSYVALYVRAVDDELPPAPAISCSLDGSCWEQANVSNRAKFGEVEGPNLYIDFWSGHDVCRGCEWC